MYTCIYNLFTDISAIHHNVHMYCGVINSKCENVLSGARIVAEHNIHSKIHNLATRLCTHTTNKFTDNPCHNVNT